jgi:HSP20 family molecular chaperone IbpA
MNIINSSRNGRHLGPLLDPMRLFDDLVTWRPAVAPLSALSDPAFSPPLCVESTEDGMTVTVDMPGVDAADLDLTYDAGQLTITGKRGERTRTYRVTLDDTLDPATIDAALDRGVLTLRARKRPESKPRKILVNGATRNNLEVGAPAPGPR